MAERLTEEIFTALGEQTVTVTGTTAAEKIIRRLAEQLAQLGTQRAEIEAEILTVVDAHPLTRVLTSMPGAGVRTAARILTGLVGKSFKDAAHLASYAGIALATHPTDGGPGRLTKTREAPPPRTGLYRWPYTRSSTSVTVSVTTCATPASNRLSTTATSGVMESSTSSSTG
ncbi:hypothetical protein KocCE7_08920 [Kocuria marina subsp. indica]|nr:hypothetical protein KocCE7_08920 [Kocuria indica]